MLELRAANAYRLDVSLLGMAVYGSEYINICQIGEAIEHLHVDETDSNLRIPFLLTL